MVAGGVAALVGAGVSPKEFGLSWLLSFLFYLSLALGALFLVMVLGSSVALYHLVERPAQKWVNRSMSRNSGERKGRFFNPGTSPSRARG